MTDKRISRRKFLSASAGVAAFTIVPRHVLGGVANTAPSEKVNIAGIGIGGMGASNLRNVESENIVALCDVDDNHAAKTFKAYPKAMRYRDYRIMLEKQKDIDAVIIATPDHTHAVITIAAMNAGKHVYCQKPLTQTIYETRILTEAARKAGVVTQMGIQCHSNEGPRLTCEWIADGAIGTVKEVLTWSTLTYYPWGHAWWSTTHSEKPKDTPAIPDTLDWDLWLGPAPERPYHPCYHPARWRAWWDFGTGMLGDRGVHTFDPVFWALDLKKPFTCQATTVGGNEHVHPIASIIEYKLLSGKSGKPVKLTWYDGMAPPRPEELEDERRFGGSDGGILFIGDKGKLMTTYIAGSPRLIPESKMKDYELPEKTIPRATCSHEMDWVNAIKTGSKPLTGFDYSGPLNEAVVLGNIAKRFPNTILQYDAENMKVTNKPEANEYISRPYRNGWTL